MRRFLTILCLPLILAACGGGGDSSPSAPPPIAQPAASAPEACPSGDATALLQTKIDAAPGVLELPACTFKTSAPLVIRKPIHFFGQGERATLIVSSADEAIQVLPQGCVGQGNRSHFNGFAIDPATPGVGKAAMVIRMQAAGDCINNFEIEHIYFGDFGPVGLLVDNATGAAPGAFVGLINFNRITNGLKLIDIADSVRVVNNSMPDGPTARKAKAGGQWGVDVSTVGGAARLVISDNNITTPGGCIRVRNTTNAIVSGNWCEFPEYYGYDNLGQLATFQLTNVRNSKIEDNLVVAHHAQFAMVLDGGSEFNALDSNELSLGAAGHLAFLDGAHSNLLMGLPLYRGGVPDMTVGQIVGADRGLISNP